jgi:hypothetical protein
LDLIQKRKIFFKKKALQKKMYQWLSSWFVQETKELPQTIPKNGITSQHLQSVKLRTTKKQDRCPFSGYQLKEMKKALKPVIVTVPTVVAEPEAIYIRNHLRPTSQQLW